VESLPSSESAVEEVLLGQEGAFASAQSASSTSTPVGYTGYRAILSTTDNRIFVAGGIDGDDENQQIWAYDLKWRRWSLATRQASPAPTGRVRSMAYDAARNWLYVLFEADSVRVDLVRYDLQKDSAQRILRLNNNHIYPGAYLNTLSDGTLVLTASNPQGYISYAYNIGRNTQFLGVVQGTNTIPFPPQLGGAGLVLPLVDASKSLTYFPVTRTSFSGGQPCTAL
jgi:hypothetical protein